MQKKIAIAAVVMSALALLSACAVAPTAPSIMALPGTNRGFDVFRADDRDCRSFASQQVAAPDSDPGVRSAVVGTAVGAVAGAAIGGRQGAGVGAGAGLLVGSAAGAESSRSSSFGTQRQYDHAYIQCMYGRGHKVPVSAEFAKSLTQNPARSSLGGNLPPPPPYPPSTLPPPDYVPTP